MRGSDIRLRHFLWDFQDGVATITFNRPERKNPFTFESYAELRDTFELLRRVEDVKVVVITGAGGNFCSGGDVHEIIRPLLDMDVRGKLAFTRMTGELVVAMRRCPQPLVAAVDGVCVGAGAVVAAACDLRLGTARSRVAFLFNRVGLAGSDMGACALLPRIVGLGRAAELLYTGREMSGEEAERWGFFNRLCPPERLLQEAQELARQLAKGPVFAHAMTKRMLHKEWDMSLDEAVESEAQAQALCMLTQDFARGYEAFVQRRPPEFRGD
ncbi:MAG: enoyl-CoA hydratase family protein [Armatimonadota bacterium]|nr:enoyl-CoA hydratase family protein [Armatimonadota bacterium]